MSENIGNVVSLAGLGSCMFLYLLQDYSSMIMVKKLLVIIS